MKDISLYEKMNIEKNNFPIKLLTVTRAPYLMPHWHEHIELLFFYSGRCEAFCDGNKSLACAGDLIVANSTEIHSFVAEEPTDFFALIVSPTFFDDIAFHNKLIKNHIPQDPFVADCFFKIRDEYKSKTIGSDMLVKSYVYSLFAHLVRNYSATNVIRDESRQSSLDRLDKIFYYISKNYNEEISAKKLADICFVTESYFCRFFKKTTGLTLAHYLIEFRIKKAQILLEKTETGIAGIAESVGIDDANYFSRIFKKVTGYTPTKYRENYKSNQNIIDKYSEFKSSK